ncbi:histidinol-phosphate transaminase [Thioalkalivibrio sp.]|uniref:histidinol-phosphate transaminase n=1 Tax=Thioalkalivibrio sp. TaxID=2093813 RepID=UPI00356AD26C
MVDFAALAVPGVQALRPYEPGKPVETLERELGILEAVKLASNENALGPSPRAVEAAGRALGNLHIYPDGNGLALKEALAERHGVVPEQVTLGNGSNEVLELVARTWLAPGRNAVYSRHAFAVYPLVVQAVAAEGRAAAARPADSGQPYGHDLDAMAAEVDADTRVVFVANPNNPTGTWLTATALERFITQMPAETLVVVDEAYAEYVEHPDYPDTTRWLQRFPNLLVTRSFSKIHGLAGLRLGYAVSSVAVAELMNRVRQPFNVNTLAQAAGLAAISDTGHVAESVRMNRDGLQQLGAGLRQRGIGFIPSVGNFLTFDIAEAPGPVYERLLREGVIVRPVANYGLPTHLRVTVGTPKENERFLRALDVVLKA